MTHLYVNAVNNHTGGGKTQLIALLQGLQQTGQPATIFIDASFTPPFPVREEVILIPTSKMWRPFVGRQIKKLAAANDTILYFGNLPPLVKFRQNVVLLLSSRFYVDKMDFSQFSWRDSLKIKLEIFYFRLFIKNVSSVITLTSTMRKLFHKKGYKQDVTVCSFDDIGISEPNTDIEKEAESYIYVASLLPYKNHRNLLTAWRALKEQAITPRLYLTLDQDNKLAEWIEDFVEENDLNVSFLRNLSRSELITRYKMTEFLIYPSSFEAYGLPLIEAKKFQLKVLSSDIDYCWDFIVPDFVFNPSDPESIARAVKRSLGIQESRDKIVTPKEFINNFLKI